ncbi:zinc finger BED domain-containing RICESLEEPER 4-like [Brachionus plicatilis]|uniref:Zinc finger BED domain-containing RICESLEEPER 4-like n=1 Tax=Brachionus plicatilis TaxID=10195 RepID=A0A3M7PX48_BRAPC|nr:zinc finger BED domain-containing RICESLEEPER 4-like [Brachionus plicatilis]
MQIDIIENTENTTSQEQNVVCSPIKRRRNESPVWEYVIKLENGNKKLAKDYLSISPSSVSSEQIFSAGGLFVTKDRTSLDPKSVKNLICLNSWKRKN